MVRLVGGDSRIIPPEEWCGRTEEDLAELAAAWEEMCAEPPPPKPTVADALISWHRRKKR